MNKNNVEISVIVPVSERYDDVRSLYNDYKDALDATGRPYEFIYVLDGEFADAFSQLASLQSEGEQIRIIRLTKWFGEATALTVGFNHSSGDTIVTLPAYYQIVPSELPKMLERLQDYDMVIARRWPRSGSTFNRVQAKVFHWILNLVADFGFHDLGCSVRAFKRKIIDEVSLYGDQHRFFPLLANRVGFRVSELSLLQAPEDQKRRIYHPGIYVRRLLDILTVFFLVKFTKKPLRFFGLIGSATFVIGGLALFYPIFERIFFGVPLADRPALLLGSLFMALGAQLFALGLVGELIIFTHASDIKEYAIEDIVE